MLIALDYDKTYTRDPAMWNVFVASALQSGHEVLCVTMRFPDEAISMPVDVVYTSRQAKLPYMAALGRIPDVWIDDNPRWIYEG